jgi:NADPH-dependent ferric siderophore reductase
MTKSPEQNRRPGVIDRTIYRMFMREMFVSSAEMVVPRFRLIELSSESLRGLTWVPGQKLQVALGSAFTTRTYTPIDFNSRRGTTRILAYTHGRGRGSDWAFSVEPGANCYVLGPRQSLELGNVPGLLAMIGDETSIGLSHAAGLQRRGLATHHWFEVDEHAPAKVILERLGLGASEIYVRRANDNHLSDIEERVRSLANEGAHFTLTGKATTIQRLRQLLRRLDVPTVRVQTKAYWAPGKAGLD